MRRGHDVAALTRSACASGPDGVRWVARDAREWVGDITDCRTFAGWVYAAFVLDAFSRPGRNQPLCSAAVAVPGAGRRVASRA